MNINVLSNNVLNSFKGNNKKVIELNGTETKAKIYTQDIDLKAVEQIKQLCNHPAFHDSPIRIMPDVHPSKNTVVGFSAPYISDKIIPGIIGGDIGCGMLCVKINTQNQEIDYKKLDDVIKTYVSSKRTKQPFMLKKLPPELDKSIRDICKKMPDVSSDYQKNALATLGGGNHFIEIDTDSLGQKYLVIHTGSRSFGKKVAEYHQNIARRQNHYFIRNLSYLSGDEAKQYLEDMKIAQEYARMSRRTIADEILYRMGWKEIESFESVHNYIAKDGIIRKGAISAEKGRDLLIPLNMRDGAILAKGKGNNEWNNSAPHGAGRKIPRAEAHQALDFSQYSKSMSGIYSTCVKPENIDEAPMAYKPSEEIIENISETADIQEIIKPLYNYKD